MKRQSSASSSVKAIPEYRYSKKTRIWVTIGSSVMALVGVLCITVSAVGMHMLSLINFDDSDHDYDPNSTILADPNDEDVTYTDPFDLSIDSSVADIPLRGNEQGVRNILLLGVDGTTFSGRSDAMIILSINDNNKTIQLISLMRDTWVTIPGRDKDKDGKDDLCKLNTAYAYGRFPLLKKTIAQNFRLSLDDYIIVNFNVLPTIIDSMGGLDIKLTAKEMQHIPDYGCIPDEDYEYDPFIPLRGEPGVHHLTGSQVLQYSRIRKIDSDFKRTERQRKVVNLCIEKAKTMSYAQLLDVLYTALPALQTNMSSDEFVGFAANALTYFSYTLNTDYHVPETGQYKGTYINGGSGLQLLNPRQTVLNLHKHLYGE